MDNSIAYKRLIKQINAVGREKLDGYYPNIIEEIYDWERNDVENLIWNAFCNNQDTGLALFLPKLKKYDGISALKEMLVKCNIPSGDSINIAKVLYDINNEKQYLDVLRLNYEKSEADLEIVSVIARCKPSTYTYQILANIYINNINSTIRSTAIDGILYNKGYIDNPDDVQEIIRQIELNRKFIKDTKEERQEMIKQLEDNKFEKYKGR